MDEASDFDIFSDSLSHIIAGDEPPYYQDGSGGPMDGGPSHAADPSVLLGDDPPLMASGSLGMAVRDADGLIVVERDVGTGVRTDHGGSASGGVAGRGRGEGVTSKRRRKLSDLTAEEVSGRGRG